MAKPLRFRPHSQKQEKVLFSKKPMVILACGIQFGKGVPVSAKVLTPDGYREAGSIKTSDWLIDRNGKPTKVVGVYPQGLRPTYKLIFRDGRTFECDDQHLHIIKPRSDRAERVESTTDILLKPHYLGKAQLPSISNAVEMPTKQYLISPYIIGCLLGDGSITKSSEITLADIEIVERISRELPEGISITKKKGDPYGWIIKESIPKRDSNGYGYSRITSELKRLQLYGKKSPEKHVPDIYKYGSITQRLDLLRGLLDTDGTVKRNKYIEFYSTSKQLASDVQYLVESLSGKAWITDKKTRCRLAYRVSIILKKYNPFYLSRKAQNYFVHENTENKVLYGIESTGKKETICFEVESPTSSFVGENQTVTHNTRVGAWRTKIAMHTFTDKSDSFIIAAPTYKTMQQATLPAFLEIMEGVGTYNKAEAVFEMHGGGKCFMRTATDPNSVVGITNCRSIWGDEAGLFPLYFHENLQARAAFKESPICYTSSPYSLNWVYTDYIRPWQKMGELPDVDIIQARSDENPYFPQAEYERKRATMDPRRFNMMFGGEFHKLEGLVYDCFDEDAHVVADIHQEARPYYIAGVDWGFTNPGVILIFAVCPKWGCFLVSEWYKSGKTIADVVAACRMARDTYGVERFLCDPSSPANILELNKAGLTAIPADNDIRSGVDAMYEMITTGKFKVLRNRAKHFLDEIAIYHYPTIDDVKPDQDKKERLPVKQHDHAMDAARYVCKWLKNTKFGIKKDPSVPGQTDKNLKLHYFDNLLLADVEEEQDW